MDRPISYSGSVPLVEDFLNSCRYAMTGLGQLALDTLGSGTSVFGLACTPTAPASLSVNIAPGRIYSVQNLDNNAYSVLAADTTHTMLKQGILADASPLTLTAPATFGFSQNWLVQASYQDSDAGNALLVYYNSQNPQQPLSGPGNSGTTQPTVRKGLCVVTLKPGTAASTGSQTTPGPDAGNVGLYVITVANGQTSVTAGNISVYPGAPLVTPLLTQLQNQRIRLAANTTFFIAPTGSDSANTGLTVGSPWATAQHAVNVLQQTYDLNGFTATILRANGTYSESVSVNGQLVGQTGAAGLVFTGSSASNVTVNGASGGASVYQANFGAAFTVTNQKIASTTGNLLVAASGGQILHSGLNFGAAGSTGAHCNASAGSLIVANGNYSISGGGFSHLLASAGGTVSTGVLTITLTGTPAFSAAFADAVQAGIITSSGCTFSGSATGPRYNALTNSIIDTGGGGANYFPGSSAGTVNTGGGYT